MDASPVVLSILVCLDELVLEQHDQLHLSVHCVDLWIVPLYVWRVFHRPFFELSLLDLVLEASFLAIFLLEIALSLESFLHLVDDDWDKQLEVLFDDCFAIDYSLIEEVLIKNSLINCQSISVERLKEQGSMWAG